MGRALWCLAAVAAMAGPLDAQVAVTTRPPVFVGSTFDDYIRLLQVSGAIPPSARLLRPLADERGTMRLADTSVARNPWASRFAGRFDSAAGRVRIELIDPVARLTNNSGIPFGPNDGALWAGKGLSGAADLGVAIEAGPISLRLAPTFWFAQNREFQLDGRARPANLSPYTDPYTPGRIDMPQRFGDDALLRADWGQSGIRVASYGVAAGFGTENMWWGPGQEHSVLMTNNAGGFRHLYVGTQRPRDIWIGDIEAMYTLGWFRHSAFWRVDAVPDSLNRRWMQALALTFRPRGAPGLYLGAARVYYAHVPVGGIGFDDIRVIFEPFTKWSLVTPDAPTGDDRRDQMLSLFGRWVLPESGFEVYGEFGRNDHNGERRDLMFEPGHASGTLLGFTKTFAQSAGLLRLSGEMTNLARGTTAQIRSTPSWYAHHIVAQGYTQEGQLIGSSVGPGGSGQTFRVDTYRRWGSMGLFVDRRRINDDTFYAVHAEESDARLKHNVLMGYGIRGSLLRGPVDVEGRLLWQTEYNRYTDIRNDVQNLHLALRSTIRLP